MIAMRGEEAPMSRRSNGPRLYAAPDLEVSFGRLVRFQSADR